ncbi:PSP1 domain-containing protein [Planctomycetaceae bacterium SH139]
MTDSPSAESPPPPEVTDTNRLRRYIVRCGVMRLLCVLDAKQDFSYSARVICRTPRGAEVGEVLCLATEQAIAQLEEPPSGAILRPLSDQDQAELDRLTAVSGDDFTKCQQQITALGLRMQLVDIERLFGGERVVVYYLAEERVDFRQLVRQLAAALQTRVEMRQIGVRDEAKLLADYGDCGKPVCCNTHLSKMPPVSMKMAKLQKATLDPAKISGRCGRLKCCLRYEFDTYEELRRELPSPGSRVVTEGGPVTVLQQEILSQQLLVQTEDNRRILIASSEVLSVISRGGTKQGGKKKSGQ